MADDGGGGDLNFVFSTNTGKKKHIDSVCVVINGYGRLFLPGLSCAIKQVGQFSKCDNLNHEHSSTCSECEGQKDRKIFTGCKIFTTFLSSLHQAQGLLLSWRD